MDEIGGNIKIGKSEHFITEACEYVEGFLKFFPFIGIILNIDEDHLDYFADINHIKHAFKKFIDLIPREGYLIANKDDKNVKEIIHGAKCNLITYANGGYYSLNKKIGKFGYSVQKRKKGK